jgi:hypothetical protein
MTRRKRKGFDHRVTKRRKDRMATKKKKRDEAEKAKEAQREQQAALVAVRGPEIQHR